MKSRKASELTPVYPKIHKMLTSRGLKPKLHMLDNEFSQNIIDFMICVDEKYQFVPPHINSRNAAERAIQTFKNRFIPGLSSVHKLFPMHLWWRLIPQSILSLNLLWGSRMNPKLSAHAQINGSFDFNATPLAPPGTNIVIHEKPGVRGSWSIRGIDSWYIGYAPFQYIFFWVYARKNSHSCIADTVNFFPHHCDMPFLSSEDNVISAIKELTHVILNPAPDAPFSNIWDATLSAISKL